MAPPFFLVWGDDAGSGVRCEPLAVARSPGRAGNDRWDGTSVGRGRLSEACSAAQVPASGATEGGIWISLCTLGNAHGWGSLSVGDVVPAPSCGSWPGFEVAERQCPLWTCWTAFEQKPGHSRAEGRACSSGSAGYIAASHPGMARMAAGSHPAFIRTDGLPCTARSSCGGRRGVLRRSLSRVWNRGARLCLAPLPGLRPGQAGCCTPSPSSKRAAACLD
jgi:hypothetical protein